MAQRGYSPVRGIPDLSIYYPPVAHAPTVVKYGHSSSNVSFNNAKILSRVISPDQFKTREQMLETYIGEYVTHYTLMEGAVVMDRNSCRLDLYRDRKGGTKMVISNIFFMAIYDWVHHAWLLKGINYHPHGVHGYVRVEEDIAVTFDLDKDGINILRLHGAVADGKVPVNRQGQRTTATILQCSTAMPGPNMVLAVKLVRNGTQRESIWIKTDMLELMFEETKQVWVTKSDDLNNKDEKKKFVLDNSVYLTRVY